MDSPSREAFKTVFIGMAKERHIRSSKGTVALVQV